MPHHGQPRKRGVSHQFNASVLSRGQSDPLGRNLLDRENTGVFRGQEDINRQFMASMTQRGTSFLDRAAKRRETVADFGGSRRAFMAPPPRQSNGLEDIRNDASNIASAIRGYLSGRPGQGGVLGSVNVGKVEIAVTVPAGTEAAAASRIADVGQRVFWQQVLQQAQSAFVPQLQPTGG